MVQRQKIVSHDAKHWTMHCVIWQPLIYCNTDSARCSHMMARPRISLISSHNMMAWISRISNLSWQSSLWWLKFFYHNVLSVSMYIRLLQILCMRNNTRAWENSVPLFSNRKTCSYLSTTSSGAKRGDLVKPWQTEIVSMKLSEAFNVHWISNWEHNLQVLLEERGKRFPCFVVFLFSFEILPHS